MSYYLGRSRPPLTNRAFYDLRYVFKDATANKKYDCRVCSLSHDIEPAIRLAKELTNVSGDFVIKADIAVFYDGSVLPAGKYRGKTIYEVWDIDFHYLDWMRANTGLYRTYKETAEIVTALFKHYSNKYGSCLTGEGGIPGLTGILTLPKNLTEKEKRIQVMRGVAEYLEDIRDNRGGYRDKQAYQLSRGIIPDYKELNRIIDILALNKGGRGSSEYAATCTKLWGAFNKLLPKG